MVNSKIKALVFGRADWESGSQMTVPNDSVKLLKLFLLTFNGLFQYFPF